MHFWTQIESLKIIHAIIAHNDKGEKSMWTGRELRIVHLHFQIA